MKIMCPFFREECSESKCAAYSLEDFVGKACFSDKYKEAVAITLQDQSYCNVLKIHLPIKKDDD